jgi:hypothetical protein
MYTIRKVAINATQKRIIVLIPIITYGCCSINKTDVEINETERKKSILSSL